MSEIVLEHKVERARHRKARWIGRPEVGPKRRMRTLARRFFGIVRAVDEHRIDDARGMRCCKLRRHECTGRLAERGGLCDADRVHNSQYAFGIIRYRGLFDDMVRHAAARVVDCNSLDFPSQRLQELDHERRRLLIDVAHDDGV
jgi:hypothetical protein